MKYIFRKIEKEIPSRINIPGFITAGVFDVSYEDYLFSTDNFEFKIKTKGYFNINKTKQTDEGFVEYSEISTKFNYVFFEVFVYDFNEKLMNEFLTEKQIDSIKNKIVKNLIPNI